MAMPTSALVIALIFEVTNEMTLTANPMIDNTTATNQAQLFALNRPYATISDAIPRGINTAPNTVKIDPLPCASAVIPPSKVKAPAITKRTPNIVTPVGLCLIRESFSLFLLIFIHFPIMESNDLRFFIYGSVSRYRMLTEQNRTKCATYFND